MDETAESPLGLVMVSGVVQRCHPLEGAALELTSGEPEWVPGTRLCWKLKRATVRALSADKERYGISHQ